MSGRVVGSGRFRVDRKRALDKMERFQLEDPHRYVLEWFAAAVLSGTARIDIDNDADDFVMRFDGFALGGDALDGLFDHLWGTPSNTHDAVVQHLALGVLGALGLQPRWIRLRSDDGEVSRELSVTDPTETRHTVGEATTDQGMRCHVREQLTATTLREALTAMFQDPAETRLVEGAARWCPVPVWINGRAIAPPPAPEGIVLSRTCAHGVIWLTVGPGQPLDLVRHGVVVAHHRESLGQFTLGGHWQAEGLKLNASRSEVVHDGSFATVVAAIGSELDTMLHDDLGPAFGAAAEADTTFTWRGGGDRRDVKTASHAALLQELALLAFGRLVTRKVFARLQDASTLGPLQSVPCFVDLHGQSWSLATLRQAGRPFGMSRHLDDDDPDCGVIVFAGACADRLASLFGPLQDHTEVLEARAKGRRRRARADRRPPWFAEAQGVHFEEGRLRGAIRRDGAEKKFTIEVRVDGMGLCVVAIDGPVSGLQGILDHPDFGADHAFTTIIQDEVFNEARKVLSRRAMDFVVAEAERGPWPKNLELVTDALSMAAKPGQRLGSIAIDQRLRQLPVVPCAGTRLSVAQIVAHPGVWFVGASLSGFQLADQVLQIPKPLQALWLTWLGEQGQDEVALQEAAERQRRMAEPRKVARLSSAVERAVDVNVAGMVGQLGTPYTGLQARVATLTVLRDGVHITDLMWSTCDLPGIIGIVDDPTLEVSGGYDAVLPSSRDRLLERLAPSIDALAIAWWDASPALPLPEPLIHWVGARTHREDIAKRPLIRLVNGEVLTLWDLRMRKRNKDPVLEVVPTAPGTPGFEKAVVHTQALERLLDLLLPNRWRMADLVRAKDAQLRFLRQRPLMRPAAVASQPVAGEGWQGVAMLPKDEPGVATVTVLYEGRKLCTERAPSKLGAHLFVDGSALLPRPTFSDVQNTSLLAELVQEARKALLPLLEQVPAELLRPSSWAVDLLLQAGKVGASKEIRKKLDELPVCARVAGAPLSLREVAALEVIVRVDPNTPEGPAPHDGVLLDAPGLDDVLSQYLRRTVARDDSLVPTHRKALARQQRLPKLPATVRTHLTVLGRSTLPEGGEVALVEHSEGLSILPLVDGMPLNRVSMPAPVAIEAVVCGEGVQADANFLEARKTAGWERRVVEIWRHADGLVAAAVAQAATTGERLPWAWRVVLAGTPRHDSAVIPLKGGGHVTRAALQARHAADGAIAVSMRMAAPRGPQPVDVRNPALRLLLLNHFVLSDLDEKWRGTQQLGLVEGHGGIAVLVNGFEVCRLDSDPVWPLEGSVADDTLTPNAAWTGVADDEAWRACLAEVAAQSHKALLKAARAGRNRDVLDAFKRLSKPWRRIPSAPDALEVVLLACPLFVGSDGTNHALGDLVTYPEIRAVAAGAFGEALSGRPPFVRLDALTRGWLAGLHRVRDANAELQVESAGARRRRARRWVRPNVPDGAARAEVDGVDIALWLTDVGAVRVLVDGHAMQTWDPCVPGLTGFVAGFFATDDAFLEANVPKPVLEQATELTRGLVRGLSRSAARGLLRQACVNTPPQEVFASQVWCHQPLFEDVGGAPAVTPTEILREAKTQRMFRWAAPATPTDGALVLTHSDASELGVLFGLPTLAHEPKRGSENRARKEVHRAGRAFTKAVLRSLCDLTAGCEAFVGQDLDALAAQGGHVEGDRATLLAAYGLASTHLDRLDRPEAELVLLMRLAPLLRAAPRI